MIRFKPGVAQAYDVFDGDVLLGSVRKKTDSYNLRRKVTVTTWLAWLPSGERIKPVWSISGYRTRAEAADALLDAHLAVGP